MPDEAGYFYYAGDRKVALEPVENTAAVAFTDAIPPRRMEALRSEAQPMPRLARSPSLLLRNVVVHRTAPGPGGTDRVDALAERLTRAPTVRFVTRVFRNPANGLHMVLTDQVSVRFKPDVTQAEIDALLAHLGLEPVEQKLYAPNQFLLQVSDPTPDRALMVANALHESPLVEWAEPNFVMEKRTRFQAFQWHLNNTGQNPTGQGPGVVGEDVDAHAAWAITEGSGNVTLAILDEGVDLTHPALQGNIAEGGRNFDDPTNPTNPNPVGDGAHGTACAGVAAGEGGRTNGMARDCRILAIKMLEADNNAIADAVHYAAQRAQVLSNSWGTSFSAAIQQAFLDVMATGREGKGTVVLFAIGNENAPIPPGDQSRIPGVIAVGASTNVGSRSGYSNHGDSVDNADTGRKRISVLACSDGTSANRPLWQAVLTGTGGVGPFENDNSTENIYTTDIQGNRGFNPQPPGSISIPEPPPLAADPDYSGLFGGTSSACPLVAGITALMLSVNANLTRAQIKYLIEATADKIGTGVNRIDVPTGNVQNTRRGASYDGTGHDPLFGFGRANAEQAVKAARGEPVRQVIRDAAGTPSLGDAIPVVLRRVPGTNHFVSDTTLELVDARRDGLALNQADKTFVRGGPGGFLRATFQPAGGGPAMSDEVDIAGQPV